MLNRNGSHISTQTASIRFRCRLTNSRRLAGLQIAHHRQEFAFLAPVQFIDPHVPQRRVPPPRVPSLQVPQIDRSYPAPRQSHPSPHLPRRRTLTCQAHRILEALAEWRLAWQQRHLLNLHAANRALYPIHLDVNGGAKLAPRQIPHRALIAIVGVGELATATGTLQLPVAAFSPDPQLQDLALLVDFLPVHAVSGPLKDSGEVVIGRQLPSLTNQRTFLRMPVDSSAPRIPAQSPIVRQSWLLASQRTPRRPDPTYGAVATCHSR